MIPDVTQQDVTSQADWLAEQFRRAATTPSPVRPVCDRSWLDGWSASGLPARSRLAEAGWTREHAGRLAALYADMSVDGWIVVFQTTAFGRFGTLDPDLAFMWLCATSDADGPLPVGDVTVFDDYAEFGTLGPYAYAAGLPAEQMRDWVADEVTLGALRALAALHGTFMPEWPLVALAAPILAEVAPLDRDDAITTVASDTEDVAATATESETEQMPAIEPQSDEPLTDEALTEEALTDEALVTVNGVVADADTDTFAAISDEIPGDLWDEEGRLAELDEVPEHVLHALLTQTPTVEATAVTLLNGRSPRVPVPRPSEVAAAR